MAGNEPDIRILVGNTGDAAPDGESAKLIRKNLQDAFTSKPAEVKLTITDLTRKTIRQELEAAAEKAITNGLENAFQNFSKKYGKRGSSGSSSGGGSNGGKCCDCGTNSGSSSGGSGAPRNPRKQTGGGNSGGGGGQKQPKQPKPKDYTSQIDKQIARLTVAQERLKQLASNSSFSIDPFVQAQLDAFEKKAQSAARNLPGQTGLTAEITKTSLSEAVTGYKHLVDICAKAYNAQHMVAKSGMSAAEASAKSATELSKFEAKLRTISPKALKEFSGEISNIRRLFSLGTEQGFKEGKAAVQAFDAAVKEAGLNGGNMFDILQNKVRSFVAYTASTMAVGGIIRAFKDALENVRTLDKAITDLQIVTGQTRIETEELLDVYNEMAQRLGTTTAQVATGATDWLRQGYTEEESAALLEQGMTLSIVGGMEAAEATTALTAAMKGYQLEVTQASAVVDKFFKVDMAAATSSAKLATALSKTAANAKLAGLSLDQVIGHLAVVSEVMQEDGEQTGTFYNTMLSRMGMIKAGRLEDPETGESLSDVESTLRGMGISLRTSGNQFRNFGEVLDEVGSKWDSYSDVQKRAVATAFAGTRQQTRFLSLMSNYEQAGKYIEMSTNSAGIAAEKLAVYQDSLAAKSAKASAAFESLSMTMINSGLVGAFYDMSAAILNMGAGLPDVVVNIGELSAALFALTTAYNALSASGVGASVRKTFSDLGWPEMTGDIVVPSYGEDAA